MAAFALQVTRSSYTTKETLDSLDVSGHEGCVSESGACRSTLCFSAIMSLPAHMLQEFPSTPDRLCDTRVPLEKISLSRNQTFALLPAALHLKNRPTLACM